MTITDRPLDSPFPPVSSASRSRRKIGDLKVLWAAWRKRRSYRRALRRLLRVGPHMVADIGLTLEEAQQEVAKPFWRA